MEKTSTGLKENIASLLCYFGFWVTGGAIWVFSKLQLI